MVCKPFSQPGGSVFKFHILDGIWVDTFTGLELELATPGIPWVSPLVFGYVVNLWWVSQDLRVRERKDLPMASGRKRPMDLLGLHSS